MKKQFSIKEGVHPNAKEINEFIAEICYDPPLGEYMPVQDPDESLQDFIARRDYGRLYELEGHGPFDARKPVVRRRDSL
jgi:hypothetical protein